MHNCCRRDTKFITDNGVFSFNDFEDGDEVNVLTHDGSFQKAVVHSYGKQDINKITFRRSNGQEAIEYFTGNHRWLLKDGKTTTSLAVGDVLMKAPQIMRFDFANSNEKERYYWCLGFVLGDGTTCYRWSHGKKHKDITYVKLRLCGRKNEYLERFDVIKHSTRELPNGDKELVFSSVVGFKKEIPNMSELTLHEKLALIDGLYCADGQFAGHLTTIFTSDEEIASLLHQYAPLCGYYITDVVDYTNTETNYGKRGFANNFKFIGENNKYFWKVVDIEYSSNDVVWCLEVENNHSFVLPNGIVTSNCLSIPFDKLLAKGFKVKHTDVRPANSINTAMQLVAVISQLQSLQQFGYQSVIDTAC